MDGPGSVPGPFALDEELFVLAREGARVPLRPQALELLLHLDRAPGNRMRMGDLATSVRLSQSGASRLVDRVERAGHVVREECDADGRVLYAQLSERGKAQLLEARPTYVASVRGRFVERFDVRLLRTLAAGWRRSQPTLAAVALIVPEFPLPA